MTNQNNTAVKFPAFKMLFGHLDLLLKSNRQAWLLCAAFAGIETLVLALGGNLFICSNQAYSEAHYCNTNFVVFVIIHLFNIFANCMFARNWVETALNKEKLKWKSALTPSKKDFKLLGLLGLYIMTLVLALVCMYILYVRVPNPNWKIEIAFFALVSVGFIIPIIALRFSSYAAFAALGEKMISPKLLWQKTAGNLMAILGGTVIIMLIYLLVMSQIVQFSMEAGEIISFVQTVIVEYIINFFKMIIIALIMNFCYMQYEILFGGNNNE